MLNLKILLAEDVHMIRAALEALLEREPDFTVVAAVGRGDEVVPKARETSPDVAVLDVDLPGVDGITAGVRLRQIRPSCRVLMLTGLGRPGTVRRALDAQVSGFLLKDGPPDSLARAIRTVAAGQRAIHPQLALEAWEFPRNPLSVRELEVLRLAALGAEIARQLFISKGTVKNHLTAIVIKLHARNRVDAVRIATEAGWIT